MMAAKKSDACTATLTLDDSIDASAIEAALATEDVLISRDDSGISIQVSGGNITDLRARLNTALRSLQAASESLIEVERSA